MWLAIRHYYLVIARVHRLRPYGLNLFRELLDDQAALLLCRTLLVLLRHSRVLHETALRWVHCRNALTTVCLIRQL